ncbi:MAG TPA: Rap1a/Tai family immunity protein [Candidatus Binataceae bacterium]|nr:Rap1a/Tai family immunity protein [Candidatus Binataceae bacterium]
MQKKIFGAVLAAVLLVSVTSAFAQDLRTGNWLYETYQEWKKRPDGDPIKSGFYIGYVTGVVEGDTFQVALGAKQHWCLPKNVIADQILDVVGRFLESHPEIRQRPKAMLVNFALTAAWPCPQK